MTSQQLASAILLIAATTSIHGAGMLLVFWMLFRSRRYAARHFGHFHNATLLTSVVVALMAVHVAEVALWASFYCYVRCFPDFATSLYFSIVTYTTLGYGDVLVRDHGWRLVGGLEALTGSLMLCWSTVILVHVVTKVYRQHAEHWEAEELVIRGRTQRPDYRR